MFRGNVAKVQDELSKLDFLEFSSGSTASSGNGPQTPSHTLPPRAGGKDDGSETNSLKLTLLYECRYIYTVYGSGLR